MVGDVPHDEINSAMELPRLLDGLASPDQPVRELAYLALEQLIHGGGLGESSLRDLIEPLLARLVVGLGETDTPSVFGRSFAALTLAEVVDVHNRHGLLTGAEVTGIHDQVLDFAACECDRRGYVPGSGWANAVGHTADLLCLLAMDLALGAPDLIRTLTGIASLASRSGGLAFICGEEERLARAVLVILHRDIVPVIALEDWLAGLVEQVTATAALPGEEVAWLTRQQNVRAFFRALAFHMDYPTLVTEASAPPYLASLLVHRPAIANELLPDVLAAIGRLSSL